jgi:hypothetical protein
MIGKPDGKDHLENVGIYGSIMIKWTLKKQNRKVRNWQAENYCHLECDAMQAGT